jgi:hypothetical protein
VLDIDEMVATALRLADIGKDIPTGVKLHPDDFAMLVKQCTAPANPSAFDLPVYVDPTVPRGTYKLMHRGDSPP